MKSAKGRIRLGERWFFLLLFILSSGLQAQELFPHNEPASTVPKGVLGVRLFGESWNEVGPFSSVERNMAALRLMYGVTSKLTLMATGTESNHHSQFLPTNLATHTHTSSGANINYQVNSVPLGIPYDYRFNGIYIYGKYRFLSIDGQNKHLRMAAYGEWSNVNVAHDEAEPNLLDDDKGYGGGLIVTLLNKRFASCLTLGFIIPGHYNEQSIDFKGGDLYTTLSYGNAFNYDLSFGYLLFPKQYKNYAQPNLNIYLEFMGKSYGQATIVQNDVNIVPTTPLLLKGNYVEVHPGIQGIFGSNLRIDFSVGLPLINKSYAVFYPVYMLGIQRYFFL